MYDDSYIKTKNRILFYKDANLLILVIDLTVRATMVKLDSWFREACDNRAGEGEKWVKSIQYIECLAA